LGIYVKLTAPRRVSPIDKALARINHCYGALRFFQQGSIFIPKTIKVWLNAPVKSLDGQLIKKIPVSNLYNDVESLRSWVKDNFYREKLFSSIVVFEGIWDFDNLKLAGFFSANNEYMWRKAYHDVEIDAYGKGDFDDLVEVFRKNNQVEALVKNLVSVFKNVEEKQPLTYREIYFSIGSAEYGQDVDMVALHLRDWGDFVGYLYSRLRKDKDEWIKQKVSPIDKSFFVKSIKEEKVVKTISSQIRKEALLVERVGNSVTYIAKDPKSFVQFYKKFKDEVFKNAVKELPEASKLKTDIRKGLERQKSIDKTLGLTDESESSD
jgi:hypothetical protein